MLRAAAVLIALIGLMQAVLPAVGQGNPAPSAGLALVPQPKLAIDSPTSGRFLGGALDPLDGTLLMCSFAVKNSSAAPITINTVTARCGCTSLQLGMGAPGRYVLQPGQDVTIRANVDIGR